MKNVQFSFDENLLKSIDRIAASYQISRSAIVREALENWNRQREIHEFEEPGSANSKRIRMILQTRKHGCRPNSGGIVEPGPLNAVVGIRNAERGKWKAEAKSQKVRRSEGRKVKWTKGTSWSGICGDEN